MNNFYVKAKILSLLDNLIFEQRKTISSSSQSLIDKKLKKSHIKDTLSIEKKIEKSVQEDNDSGL